MKNKYGRKSLALTWLQTLKMLSMISMGNVRLRVRAFENHVLETEVASYRACFTKPLLLAHLSLR